ncbi:N-formylglutamate deformylase [Bordetella bronchiseptica]|uniref:N-formylglutamate amidohydrolase n=1 Tax=Bordetella bronchiseptica (strain ATCC BAA-588 / NCTC 13252 / RB50) TaxID=257310 RepID=A0A0H3LT85_BORBR|nr:N-formylglutamate deformylase [Bordetella bronchiseptica]KAK61810.1 N-formylglutamate deformylase [Bordetella bronchiseptica 980-2]AMG86381.1 N-formylglutamate deformylase [Bordetella bronchiseptica]KAB1450438.1 N-formylglutamate deformylase [Bordetella bronchiseptica]KAB1575924.1 N-formylglutamate deformylase [Bordetella bronchiseptica]KCV49470.1 N-formylglutamate deformylase [Bordetella bronchiseptica 3E44]
MSLPIVTLEPGTIPLLISIPHGGECLPEEFARRMTPAARRIADTDWHLSRLYDFARAMGASILRANYSRYVIDVNRPSDGAALYPGQTTTTLCPVTSFHDEPLYLDPADQPDAAETARRVDTYWRPYHDAMQAELARMRGLHPQVLLWEAHSIASELPYLFEGRLPDLNIGTFSGAACAPALREAAIAAAGASPFDWVVDDRFKGGYITRHYGQPGQGVHAVQLEMTQRMYMDEAEPFAYREDLAGRVLPTLRDMVGRTLAALAQVR